MTDLFVKYNSLNKTARQEVNDFMNKYGWQIIKGG